MGYSIQREMILSILHNTDEHYTAENVYWELIKLVPSVSLMTVYRNLNKLVKDGSVLPFHVNNVQHFCGNTKSHFHFHCVDCGDIVDRKDKETIKILKQVKLKDFSALPNGMIIKGLCNNCSPKNRKE